MRRIASLAAVAAVIVGCSSGGIASDQAAVVNGEPILITDVQDRLDYQRSIAEQQATQTGQPEPDDDELSRLVLQSLIQQKLVFAGAEAEGITVSDSDVDARIEDAREQIESQGNTLEDELEARGMTQDILRQEAASSVLFERVGEHLVPGPTDEELEADLEDRPEEVSLVDARHVLAEDEETATQARDELEGGADWTDVAGEYSTDPGSKDSGGELGTIRRGATVPEFDAKVFELAQEGDCADAPGECASSVSEPVESQFGWHVIQVTAVRLPTLEELRADADQTIGQERQQGISGWYEELTASAEVEVNSRFGEWDPAEGGLVDRDTAPQEPDDTQEDGQEDSQESEEPAESEEPESTPAP